MNVLIDPAARPVIAHRGNCAHAPENTFPSFDQAVALGADALEFDVRLTRDGHVVVIHDAMVDRTTNGSGPVSEHTLDELTALDAGARFGGAAQGGAPFRGQGLVVPTLDELLRRYSSIPLLIEVKVPEAVEPTRRLLEVHGAIKRTVVDSTDPEAVNPFRGGALATGASFRDVAALIRQCWRRRLTTPLAYEALCIPRWYYGVPIPVARLAHLAASVGSVTHVWTVNSAKVARQLWAAGVNGIITDDPGVMRSVRASMFG
jgi:glycerophosphoryl diester phosphodiesterase